MNKDLLINFVTSWSRVYSVNILLGIGLGLVSFVSGIYSAESNKNKELLTYN